MLLSFFFFFFFAPCFQLTFCRVMFIECLAKYCPCGENCTNRRFQLRQHAPVERFRTNKKGWGLQAKSLIRQGDFVIEYVGEVIDTATCQQRLHEYQAAGIANYYFLTLDGSECIDASLKGNLARFINHSCNPNCTTQKWYTVIGRSCLHKQTNAYFQPIGG